MSSSPESSNYMSSTVIYLESRYRIFLIKTENATPTRRTWITLRSKKIGFINFQKLQFCQQWKQTLFCIPSDYCKIIQQRKQTLFCIFSAYCKNKITSTEFYAIKHSNDLVSCNNKLRSVSVIKILDWIKRIFNYESNEKTPITPSVLKRAFQQLGSKKWTWRT